MTVISFTYRSNLHDFRRWVTRDPNGKKRNDGESKNLAQSLKKSGYLKFASNEGLLDEVEGIKELRFVEETWVSKLEKALAKGMAAKQCGRFSPESYLFRVFWGTILENEKASGSPRLGKGFGEWCDDEGWKFGITPTRQDTLKTRCKEEDKYVDDAYLTFGYTRFTEFLKMGAFSYHRKRIFQDALKECIESKRGP